ncbi:zinc finger protein 595-like isoform X2 [Thrips palmi]|uniref:Zinc finger protein 595-like isoform X2 n=1 Tax=Thrips palmi TaxID=161013 RepID=A0A6P8ZIC5_THRPL|nr:zinc finger protein 595-like isoform X2 [Thrips palmi]
MAESAEDAAMEPELILDPVKVEPESKDSLCRLCACSSELLIPILEGEGLENSLADKIEKYLPIQVAFQDPLPLQVCFHCASTVISWHELSTSCIDAQHKLQAMFSETTSEAPVSPAASRDYDADICEDIVPDTTDLETSGPTSPDIQNAFKEHSEQVQEIDDSKMDTGVHQKGETERCLQEVKLEGISEKLMCQICSIVFTDTSSLDHHSQMAHAQLQHSLESGGTMFSCHICSVSFLAESDRDSHSQLEHGVSLRDDANAKPDISQNCQFCGRFFRHFSVLNMHSISCKKLLGNSEGSEDFSDYVTLDESITFDEPESTQDRNESFKRGVAKRSAPLTSLGRLDKSHIESKVTKKNIHPIVSENIPAHKRIRQSKDNCEKRVSCAYCIKSFNGKYEAIAHVSKSHRKKLEEFLVWLQRRKLYLKDKLCSICDKTFTSTQEAAEHVQSCHKDGTKESLRCELCLIEFCDELDLLKHIANHSASDDGSKLFFELKTTEFDKVIAFNELPSSLRDKPEGNEKIVSCVDVEKTSGNFARNEHDSFNAGSVSNIMETCINSNVSLSQKSTKEECFDEDTTIDVNSSKMDGTSLLVDSFLNGKEIFPLKTNSESSQNTNLGSCNLGLPLLTDNSTEKSDLVNSMTQ